jgi:hypothetical protein
VHWVFYPSHLNLTTGHYYSSVFLLACAHNLPTRTFGTWQRARFISYASMIAARLASNIAFGLYVLLLSFSKLDTQVYTSGAAYACAGALIATVR